MAYISQVDYETASPEVREQIDTQICEHGRITNMKLTLLHSLPAYHALMEWFPFHEVVDAIDVMGRGMSSDLLCTSRGGMCATPTGRRSRKDFQDWYKSIL